MYHGACFATTLIHWNTDFMRGKVQRRTIIATNRNLKENNLSQVSNGLNMPFQSTGIFNTQKNPKIKHHYIYCFRAREKLPL